MSGRRDFLALVAHAQASKGVQQLYTILPGKLYQSALVTAWDEAQAAGCTVSINVSGERVPNQPGTWITITWSFADGALPDLETLGVIAQNGADMIAIGRCVITNCAAGINRSSLVNGLILHQLGIVRGAALVRYLRDRRPGALSNETFANYLAGLDT